MRQPPRVAPTTGLSEPISVQSFMSVVTDTTNHENGCRAEDGQPQGLPLRQVCRGLFSEEWQMLGFNECLLTRK